MSANTPSRSNRTAGNPGTQPVQFTMADAQRIASVVAQVEGARRSRRGSSSPRAVTVSAGIVEGTYQGAWPKGVTKAISIKQGTATTAVNCINKLNSIMPGAPSRLCYVCRSEDDTTVYEWFLVNAEA